MKPVLTILFLFLSLFLFIPSLVYCQDGSQSPPKPDDDFNVFLLVFAAISAMLGAALAGAIFVVGFLLLAGAFVGFGILSVSVLAGIYKRSITAGFKTFLYITCPVAGIGIGVVGFYILTELFHLSISRQMGLVAGILGGLVGGLLMALAIHQLTSLVLKYLLKKFQLNKLG
jgi:hypothetical protein